MTAFDELADVLPVEGGHVSVAVEHTTAPTELVGVVRDALTEAGIRTP